MVRPLRAEAAYASFGAPWSEGMQYRKARPRRRLCEVGFSPYRSGRWLRTM